MAGKKSYANAVAVGHRLRRRRPPADAVPVHADSYAKAVAVGHRLRRRRPPADAVLVPADERKRRTRPQGGGGGDLWLPAFLRGCRDLRVPRWNPDTDRPFRDAIARHRLRPPFPCALEGSLEDVLVRLWR